MKRSVLSVLAVLLLAGCASAPQAYRGKDYGREAPLRLNVGAVLVDTEYQAPASAPNVDHQMNPTPEDLIRTAIAEHYTLLRAGRTHAAELRFVIKEASVTETALPQPDSWLDRTTSEKPEFHYDGRMVVEATASGAGTRRTGSLHAEATRSMDVGQMSEGQRASHVKGMVHEMLDDIMVQIDQQMNTNLGGLVYGDGTNDQTIMPELTGRWDTVMQWK